MNEKRKPGRPAVHLDGADRQAAYRERCAHRSAVAEAALFLTTKPTPDFVRLMVERLLAQARDPAEAKADLLAWINRM